MYTADALLDLHTRTHRSLARLLDHCEGFTAEELDRELEGFGYGSVRSQLHHVLGAERYWVGVLRGEMRVDEEPSEAASVDALRALREKVAAATRAYLAEVTGDELNAPRELTTWGGRVRTLVPALVVLRPLTHAYQHQGQVAAMARLLGRPVPGGQDLPLD